MSACVTKPNPMFLQRQSCRVGTFLNTDIGFSYLGFKQRAVFQESASLTVGPNFSEKKTLMVHRLGALASGRQLTIVLCHDTALFSNTLLHKATGLRSIRGSGPFLYDSFFSRSLFL